MINGDLMINDGIIYHMTRVILGIRFLMKIFNWNLKKLSLQSGENVAVVASSILVTRFERKFIPSF
ncbi:hypothetical protein V470_11060 [Streptococcus sp. VT 162]|nr:hypothetical protein V470_11060 [Streptococcus sp. VT 162]